MEADLDLAGVPIGMMQLHVVLSSQCLGPWRKQTPEQRLMIAVLHDALDCIEQYRFATTIPPDRVWSCTGQLGRRTRLLRCGSQIEALDGTGEIISLVQPPLEPAFI